MNPFPHPIPVSGIVLILVLSFGSPSGLEAQDTDRDAYLVAVSSYFQVAPNEARILMDGQPSASDLPVLLLLARESGLAPPAVLAYRRGGSPWIAVARRFELSPSRFHVDITPQEAGPALERAVRLYRDTPQAGWAGLELSDEEVVGLVHVKMFSRHFQVPAARVVQVRREAGSWIAVPARLN